MNQSIFVENIKCGGCASTIQSALMNIEGIERVVIDKSTGMVSVEGSIEKSVLLKTLSGLGYPESGKNNLFKKARSVVSCSLGKIQG